MNKNNPEQEHQEHNEKHPGNFLAGLLLGSLAGAATMLLYAPKSGQETRQQIQQKVTELRDRTTDTVEGSVAQVRAQADRIKSKVNDKAKELKQQGKEVLVDQLDRVSSAAETSKKAIQGKQS